MDSPNRPRYIFGIHPIIEAIRAGQEIDKLLLKKDLGNELLRQLHKEARDAGVPVQFVPMEKLDSISRKNHQGAIAIVSAVEYTRIEQVIPMIYEEGRIPLILVLDHITDVRNFGSVARTAECAGVDAIVIPSKGAATINADAIKTSSGALNAIAVCRVESLVQATTYLKEAGLQIVAASEKGNTLYHAIPYNLPTAIIMGAEDTGVSNELLNLSSQIVKIPVIGKVESLNVAVASGVMLYEVQRQREKSVD